MSIIGILDKLNIPNIPGNTASCQAYLQLTNGIGTYAITVEIHDLQEDTVLARARIAELEFKDRSTKVNLFIPVPALPISHEGVYDFLVLADGQEIDRQQFMAHLPGGDENVTDQEDPGEEP